MDILYIKAGNLDLLLNDKERRVLTEIAARKGMSNQSVIRMALRWLQLLEETPGAYAAVLALRPKPAHYECGGND